MGVASLELFGSTARDEAGSSSDVDLLVEFNRRITLFQVFDIQHRIEKLLGVDHVDLVQKSAVHPALRDRIYEEAIHVS